MTDFSHLKALDVTPESRARYTFHRLDGTPWIEFKPASDANKPYFNESLRRASERALQGGRGTRVTVETSEASRQEDRELISRFCAVDWGGITDSAKEPVPFSHENCLEFFKALPNHLFDPLRAWINDTTNFVDSDPDGKLLGE